MKKAIVTGANGFIGSSLIAKLLKSDYYVIALDRGFENSKLPQSNKIKKIAIDLCNIESIGGELFDEEHDIFYHLAWAGVNGPQKSDPLVQLKNIEIAVKCVQLAKKTGCKKMLCAGTIAERGVESISKLESVGGGMLYSVTKLSTRMILETYCKNIGLDFVWMQFSNIYGPNNKTGNLISYTLGELMNGREPSFGPANQPYDFIFVDDLLEAVLRLGIQSTKKHFYFIGSGEPRLLREYLLEIGQVYGCQEKIKIGERSDDGIRYTFDMFGTQDLRDEIGDYVTRSFSEGIKYVIAHY